MCRSPRPSVEQAELIFLNRKARFAKVVMHMQMKDVRCDHLQLIRYVKMKHMMRHVKVTYIQRDPDLRMIDFTHLFGQQVGNTAYPYSGQSR